MFYGFQMAEVLVMIKVDTRLSPAKQLSKVAGGSGVVLYIRHLRLPQAVIMPEGGKLRSARDGGKGWAWNDSKTCGMSPRTMFGSRLPS